MTFELDLEAQVRVILRKRWERNTQKVTFMNIKAQNINVSDKDRDQE